MSLTQATRLLTSEQIAVQAGQQVSYMRLPDRASVFSDRETRLRQLAAGHAMRDFLRFIAELAGAQHAVLQNAPALVQSAPTLALPDAAMLVAAAAAGLAPLPAESWPRDPAWRGLLRDLLDRLAPRLARDAAMAGALATVQALRAADDAHLERQAERLLQGVMAGLDLAAAPLLAAALQVYWAQLVLATEAAHGANGASPFGRTDDASRCPCCASLPTASINRIGAESAGYRYLHCSLCSTQWHMVRIKCCHCASTQGISYQSLAPLADAGAQAASPPSDAVQAETCDVCGHYLKILHMARDPHVEPVADDLASLTLDLLVAESGRQRHGVNLMLLFGEADTPADTPADAAAPPTGAPPPDPGAA